MWRTRLEWVLYTWPQTGQGNPETSTYDGEIDSGMVNSKQAEQRIAITSEQRNISMHSCSTMTRNKTEELETWCDKFERTGLYVLA